MTDGVPGIGQERWLGKARLIEVVQFIFPLIFPALRLVGITEVRLVTPLSEIAGLA
tara:strand:+ start:7443 stop:7610 length:168 start_codon:yes stop_codon:yes gene_type:complete